MGVLGLPFAESDGGVGAGPVEIGIVCRELGRVLAPEPYLTGVVLAGGLVSAAGTAEQRAEVLGAVAAGERVLAFAHDEPDGPRWATDAPGTHRDAGRRRLDAHRHQGPRPARRPRRPGRGHRHPARRAAPACSSSTPRPTATRLDRTGYPTYDGGRAARIVLDATPAVPLGDADDRPVRDHRHDARPHPGDGGQPGARA